MHSLCKNIKSQIRNNGTGWVFTRNYLRDKLTEKEKTDFLSDVRFGTDWALDTGYCGKAYQE